MTTQTLQGNRHIQGREENWAISHINHSTKTFKQLVGTQKWNIGCEDCRCQNERFVAYANWYVSPKTCSCWFTLSKLKRIWRRHLFALEAKGLGQEIGVSLKPIASTARSLACWIQNHLANKIHGRKCLNFVYMKTWSVHHVANKRIAKLCIIVDLDSAMFMMNNRKRLLHLLSGWHSVAGVLGRGTWIMHLAMTRSFALHRTRIIILPMAQLTRCWAVGSLLSLCDSSCVGRGVGARFLVGKLPAKCESSQSPCGDCENFADFL